MSETLKNVADFTSTEVPAEQQTLRMINRRLLAVRLAERQTPRRISPLPPAVRLVEQQTPIKSKFTY